MANRRSAPPNAIPSAKAAESVGFVLVVDGVDIILDDDALIVANERLKGTLVVVTFCAPAAPNIENGDDLNTVDCE